MAASKPRVGRLQRQVLRAFLACGPTVRTSDLALLVLGRAPITRTADHTMAEALVQRGQLSQSVPRRLAGSIEEWLWQLRKANS